MALGFFLTDIGWSSGNCSAKAEARMWSLCGSYIIYMYIYIYVYVFSYLFVCLLRHSRARAAKQKQDSPPAVDAVQDGLQVVPLARVLTMRRQIGALDSKGSGSPVEIIILAP